jgi:urease beta subunit
MKKKRGQRPAKTPGSGQEKKRAKRSIGRVAGRQARPGGVIPGQIFLGDGGIEAFADRPTLELTVSNLGDRPIQVGSHCHFFEVNRALSFDRVKAFGFRLQIPAGTAVRFEPGEDRQVTLVIIGGNRIVYGINGLTEGRLDDPDVRRDALARAHERGFLQKGSGQ